MLSLEAQQVKVGLEIELDLHAAQNISRHYTISRRMFDNYLQKPNVETESFHTRIIRDYPLSDPDVLNRLPEKLRSKLLKNKLDIKEKPELSLFSEGFQRTERKLESDYSLTREGVLVPAHLALRSDASISLEAWNQLNPAEVLDFIDPDKIRKEIRVEILRHHFDSKSGLEKETNGEKTVLDKIPSFSIGKDTTDVIEWRTTKEGLYKNKDEVVNALRGFANAAGYSYSQFVARGNMLSQRKSIHLNISSALLDKNPKIVRSLFAAYTSLLIQKESGFASIEPKSVFLKSSYYKEKWRIETKKTPQNIEPYLEFLFEVFSLPVEKFKTEMSKKIEGLFQEFLQAQLIEQSSYLEALDIFNDIRDTSLLTLDQDIKWLSQLIRLRQRGDLGFRDLLDLFQLLGSRTYKKFFKQDDLRNLVSRLYFYVDGYVGKDQGQFNLKGFVFKYFRHVFFSTSREQEIFHSALKKPFLLAVDVFTSEELLEDTPLARGVRAHFNSLLMEKSYNFFGVDAEIEKRLYKIFFPNHNFIINGNPNNLPYELIRFYISGYFNVEPSIESIFSGNVIYLEEISDGRIQVNVSKDVSFRNSNQMNSEEFFYEINKNISESSFTQAKSIFLKEQGDLLRSQFWAEKMNQGYSMTAFKYLDFSLKDIQNLPENSLFLFLEYLLRSNQSESKLQYTDVLEYLEAINERISSSVFNLPSRINRSKAQSLLELIVKNDLYRKTLFDTLNTLADRVGFQSLQRLLRKSPSLRPYLKLYRNELIDFLELNGKSFTQSKYRIKFPSLKRHLQDLQGTQKTDSIFDPISCRQSSKF
ncbi:MAG: hypothetical protein VX583_06890 [Bdellovibrionota bacterium]